MYNMQELNISPLSKYFKSTGAKDHPYFWIEGAGSFIPNMLECISLTEYTPTVKKYTEFENDSEEELKELFIKYGSNKFINPYYKYYSNILSSKTDINILEIGMGTKNTNIAIIPRRNSVLCIIFENLERFCTVLFPIIQYLSELVA